MFECLSWHQFSHRHWAIFEWMGKKRSPETETGQWKINQIVNALHCRRYLCKFVQRINFQCKSVRYTRGKYFVIFSTVLSLSLLSRRLHFLCVVHLCSSSIAEAIVTNKQAIVKPLHMSEFHCCLQFWVGEERVYLFKLYDLKFMIMQAPLSLFFGENIIF